MHDLYTKQILECHTLLLGCVVRFDGNRNYSDESDDEGVDAESQPIARQLFRTPANVSGLASCASLSGVEDRDTSGHNTR